MILKKVKITDFLSVRGSLSFDLDKAVTILLGANDHGKSNLLSAIQCLNDDSPIQEGHKNWDAGDDEEPRIEFEIALTSEERQRLASLLDEECQALEEQIASAAATESDNDEDEEADEKATAPPVLVPKPPGVKGMSPVDVEDDEEDEDESSDPVVLLEWLSRLKTNLKSSPAIVIVRNGIDRERSVGGGFLSDLPAALEKFFGEGLPRVELFQSNSSSLQDSVTAEQITTPEFEFLQGIFYYADLDPMNSAALFKHTDTTQRKLENASKVLNDELRKLWAQGVDLGLNFHLSHRQPAIEFLADDPSVASRKTRMSKRSTGVTQFFRLSVVLHARRKKNPANSYIYLFDEPGIYLHPKGQKDLIQVFEQLSGDAQIVYATHSLFLLNQNFPERHRLIIRDAQGTKVDQKPYRNNWQLATDALGVQLTANILFCPCVLLVEGDSDPIYIYELFRHFNRKGDLDVDANLLGIYAYSDLKNLRFLIQTFKRENLEAQMLVLFDGDKTGGEYFKLADSLCASRSVGRYRLEEGLAIEDYALDRTVFYAAALQTLKEVAGTLQKELPEEKIAENWRAYNKEPGDKNLATWFSAVAKEFVDKAHGVSKIALARNYAFLCRDQASLEEDPLAAQRAMVLCRAIQEGLNLPQTRAQRVIEAKGKAAE